MIPVLDKQSLDWFLGCFIYSQGAVCQILLYCKAFFVTRNYTYFTGSSI